MRSVIPIGLVWAAAVASAQIASGPQLVQRLANASSMRDFSFASLDLQEIRPGREGPGYVDMKGEPAPGARQVADARIYGQGAVRNVRFEEIDQSGRLIAPLAAIRLDHDPDDGEYMLLIEVPTQPFRVRVAGVDLNGAPYQ